LAGTHLLQLYERLPAQKFPKNEERAASIEIEEKKKHHITGDSLLCFMFQSPTWHASLQQQQLSYQGAVSR
jgi:hypothetical protein